jgi:hypothetical protein
LPRRQEILLQHCATFQTLEQLGRLAGFSRDDLDALESAGLVETDATILRRCAARTEPLQRSPITDLGILTCASPDLLKRSVGSWIEFSRYHERELHITIVDDSPNEALAGAQRAAAKSLERELGIELRFVDPGSRSALGIELARHSGVDPELVAFALAGRAQPRIGIGGNRNVLALLTRGRRVLSADDDILAQFETPPRHDIALWILSEEVPTIKYFFESVAETESQVSMSPAPDALQMHEAFVGHTVADVVARLAGSANLIGARPSLTGAIQERPVRIAATALGLVGDSASDCAAFFSLLATGETERNFLARPATLPESREEMRRPFFPVLCQGAYLMTYCHALDNTLPLPPFFPVGRGEDQVWQKLLHWTLPDTVVGHLPMAVRHRPTGTRVYTRSDYLDPCATFEANAFLLGILGTCPQPSPEFNTDERLAFLGRHLADVAQNPSRFAALVQDAWRAYHLEHHHDIVRTALDSRPNNPESWRSNLMIVLDRLNAQLQERGPAPFAYASFSDAEAIDVFRLDLLKFARLLQAWPAIRTNAERYVESLGADSGWLRP